MRWDIFAVGDGVDIPNLVDDLGKTAMVCDFGRYPIHTIFFVFSCLG